MNNTQGQYQGQNQNQAQPQRNQPIDKGRAAIVAERYQVGNNQTKNRYATIGRATKWPSQNGESVELELDTMPIGHTGPLKVYIFWDSQENNQSTQPMNNQAGNYNNQSQQNAQAQGQYQNR
jgi:hypothetical protein